MRDKLLEIEREKCWWAPAGTTTRSYIVGPASSQIVRTPKKVHRKSNTERSVNRGDDNIPGHKQYPTHSLKKRKYWWQFYSDSLDG